MSLVLDVAQRRHDLLEVIVSADPVGANTQKSYGQISEARENPTQIERGGEEEEGARPGNPRSIPSEKRRERDAPSAEQRRE